MLQYQYGQNFDIADNGGKFYVHQGDWINIRLPEEDAAWELYPLPDGIQLDMDLYEDYSQERTRVFSFKVDELAPIGDTQVSVRAEGRWWSADFHIIPG